MKKLICLIAVLLIYASVYADCFPIGAWGIKQWSSADTTIMIDSIKTAWHGNYVNLVHNKDSTIVEDFLNAASNDSIGMIAWGLTRLQSISLTHMARGQFSLYESEAHNSTHYYVPGYFNAAACTGQVDYDPDASNDSAWTALVGSNGPGYIQQKLIPHRWHRQEFNDFPTDTSPWQSYDGLAYEAKFFLKIPDTTDQQLNKKVCRIEVWWDSLGTTSIIAYDTLYRSAFSDTAVYDSFSLWFTRDSTMEASSKMDYRIWWYDNYNLYADRVEIRDSIYCELSGVNWNAEIENIVAKWDPYPALKYYSLWDEPKDDQFETFQLVKYKMGVSKEPIACVGGADSDDSYKWNHYMDFIRMCYGSDDTPFYVDGYFLRHEDSLVSTVQHRFDSLCDWMDVAREIADTTGTVSRRLWYICQAHSWKPDPNGEFVLRDPTPQEMWALVGLGLAHGAEGIWYFRYMSRYWNDNPNNIMIHGLVDWDGNNWEHNKKWEATKNINAVLQVIDTFLLDFDFQNAFKGNNLQDYIEYCNLGSLSEFGLFEDSDNLDYFMMVNRTDSFFVGDTFYPDSVDSSLVTLGLDGSLHSGWYYIRDCYSGEPYRYDSTSSGEAPATVYFNFYLKDCHFKLFQLVPFTCDIEINSDSSYTDYPFVKVYFDTITGVTFDDSMYVTIWSDEGDTLENARTDTSLIWKFQSPGSRTLTASFKLFESNYIQGDSGYLTPTYCDTIYLDTIPPSSNSLEVEDVDTLPGFVNSDSVDLSLSSTKAAGIPVRKMRFSNYGFDNLIQNPDFSDTTYWVCVDSATIDSGYGEIDGDFGGVIFQNIDDSLFVEEKVYRLSVHVVTDSFISDSGRIQLTYLYADTVDGDTSSGSLKTIELSDGDQALTGYNCISDTFTYAPSPSQGSNDTTLGCRLEIHQNNNGNGRLIIDNFLLEREYTESCWHDYDTTYSDWVLTSGDGEKVVSGVFRDAAGNITNEVADTVILDKTLPIDTITSPRPMQIISGKINIRGWAHDSASAEQHFYYYKLEYKPTLGGTWNDCDTIEYYYEPKYPDSSNGPPSVVLGEWNTSYAQNGIYYLRLSVVDSASNLDSTRIIVSVNNQGKEGSGEFKAGKEPTGISWSSHLYVTDIMDGDLRRYNLKGDSIGYISLIKDSVGISKPCAVATDSGGIWIADKHRHRVSYYDYTGNPLFEFGGFGNKEGKFNHPSGIARFNDKIYVTDKLNHRVQVFSNDSSYIFSFGIKGDSAGQFNEPSGIASDRHGRIYITDRINNRIEVFDTTGEYIEYYGEEIELQHPCGILVDSFGYIFVVDEVNGKVWELDPFGDPICQFGEKGEEFGMLLFPQDIAISGDGEKIYVTDRVRKKVVIYDVYDKSGGGGMSAGDVETPIYNCLKACYPVPFSKGVTVSYSIAQKGYVSVKVYDVTGRLIRNLVQGIQDRGWYMIQWDGNDKSSRQVSSGVYFIRLEIDNFLSTKKVLLVK